MHRFTLLFVIGSLAAACASSTQPAASPSSAATDDSAATAVAPDTAKTTAHLEKHVTYPATREQLLAACAGTAEFSAGERKWFEEKLPPGTYASAADVEKALGLASSAGQAATP